MSKLDEPVGRMDERGRAFYRGGPRVDANLKPAVKLIQPGTFSDGQARMGTPRENIHRDKPIGYADAAARAYRADLGARPSANRKSR